MDDVGKQATRIRTALNFTVARKKFSRRINRDYPSSTFGMGPLGRAPRSPMGSGGVEHEVVLGQSGVLPWRSHRWCRRARVFERRGGVPARRILLAQPSLFRPFQGDLLMRPRYVIAGCLFAPPAGRTDVEVSPPRGVCIRHLGTGDLGPRAFD
jgi:hypothetical protein